MRLLLAYLLLAVLLAGSFSVYAFVSKQTLFSELLILGSIVLLVWVVIVKISIASAKKRRNFSPH